MSPRKGRRRTRRVSIRCSGLRRECLALRSRIFQECPRRGVHTIPHRTVPSARLVNVRVISCSRPLADILGIESADRDDPQSADTFCRRMVVITDSAERWVFPVDEVDRVYRLYDSQLGPVPTTIAKDASAFSRTIAMLDKRRVAVLDEEL